jgi:predicted Zn-dependent peptidase
MTRIRAALLRNHEQQSQNNGYVLSEVARVYALGEADRITTLLDLPSRIDALTGEALQRAAQTYLDTRNFVRVTQVPAKQ